MSNGGEDGFLTRWARRKAEARDAAGQEAAGQQVVAPAAPEAEAAEPFDVSTLPSINSLTADCDLTAFMQKGVPAALRDAAISRMWVTDPAIRNYIGPSEMSWDFNAGEAFHGYGALAPGTDVGKMIAEIVGPRTPEAVTTPGALAAEAAAPETLGEARLESPPAAAEPDAERVAVPAEAEVETAVAEPEPAALPHRRRHGGATPV